MFAAPGYGVALMTAQNRGITAPHKGWHRVDFGHSAEKVVFRPKSRGAKLKKCGCFIFYYQIQKRRLLKAAEAGWVEHFLLPQYHQHRVEPPTVIPKL